MKAFFFGLLLLGSIDGQAGPQYSFNFMQKYNIQDLATNSDTQAAFMRDVMTWEGRFATDSIGINYASGLTYDGAWLHYETGLPYKLHDFSAASKESVHLGMLALAVSGNANAQIFFTSAMPSVWQGNLTNYLLDQLTKKITSYEKWNTAYPGFGGYLPWYHVSDTGASLLPNWDDSVPSLDNGEMIWSIAAAVQALRDANQVPLANRYQAYMDLLANTGVHIFYNTTKKCMAAVSMIDNITADPWSQTYNTTSYYLDDPYEGELFTLFVELYGNWSEYADADKRKDDIWITKRAKAIPVNYTDGDIAITVQRGYTFSSHEQWKFMELPYFDVDIANRLYLNGERARAYHSWKNNYPGLFAAVTNVTEPSNSQLKSLPAYVSAVGIASIAFRPIVTNDLFTPYGAYPLMLHPNTTGIGLAWYANMLGGPYMQGPQGSTESLWIDGSMISPVQTWDSKITSVLAMNGGILDLTRKYLNATNKYTQFIDRIDKEWKAAFGAYYSDPFPGSTVDFKLPTAQFYTPVMSSTSQQSTSTTQQETSTQSASTTPQQVTSTEPATTPQQTTCNPQPIACTPQTTSQTITTSPTISTSTPHSTSSCTFTSSLFMSLFLISLGLIAAI